MNPRRILEGLALYPADRPDRPVHAILTYTDADPYAVRIAFMNGDIETVAYTFARGLLADGLYEGTGQGDVIVGPHHDRERLVLTLRHPDSLPYTVYADLDRMTQIVALTYQLVPMGREHEYIDWDTQIAALYAAHTGHRTEVTLWQPGTWLATIGVLSCDPGDPAAVVIQAAHPAGHTATWRLDRAVLSYRASEATDGWIRLTVPGGGEVLLQCDQALAFLKASAPARTEHTRRDDR